jgi:hypothetical protein
VTSGRSDVDTLVRRADPVSDSDVAAWVRSGASDSIYRTVVSVDPATAAAGPAHARPRRALAIALALVVLGAGAAAAGVLLFGGPAPKEVKRDLRGVDAGYPADLRLNPDVEQARSVASTGSSTLYYASLKDGGFCTEIVTGGSARGAVCTTGQQLASLPIEVSVPFTEPITDASPVTIAGRVNAPGAMSLEVQFADGSTDQIPFGDDRFFIFDVPAEHLASTHHGDFKLVATDQAGHRVAEVRIPAVVQEDVEAQDRQQPIFVSTISDGNDLTKVLGVEGSVNVPGAVTLELQYPDGTTVEIPLGADGTYRLDLPTQRQGDLFPQPGLLTARDAAGHPLATAAVAAVAYWRSPG